MATRIHVACRSSSAVTDAELADYMAHMGFLDEPPTIAPTLAQMGAGDPQWRSFELGYLPDKRPIVVRHHVTRDAMAPAFEDLRERLEDVAEAQARTIGERLDHTAQLFVFEVPDDLPQDVWEMLDATEAFLARERDGIVIAEEGVFDAELNQLVEFPE
jgi:hypothetical protein